MTRVIKTDYPPIKMVVEGTRLVPISQYDAERIDSYRRGTTLNVFITHEKQRVDEKRWWAAINRAVKECRTPWKTAVQASEAIKLAIGVINYSKTVSGSFMQYPKSLTELDDSELADAVRDLYDVLFGVTGVDPAEWKRHGAEIQEDPDTSAPSPADVSGDSTIPPPGAVAATEPAAAEPGPGAGAPEEQDGPVSAPAPATGLSAEDRAWLVEAARTLIPSAAPGGDPDVVRRQYAGLLKTMPKAISKAAVEQAISICRRLVAVCESSEDLDLDLIAGLAKCDVADLSREGR